MRVVPDDVLVARAREGDRGAMQELLESIAPTIHRFALRMCRNEADADDVLQDALLSIAQNLRSFEGRSSLPSWTFTLARSACSRKRRGLANQPMEDERNLETRASDRADPEEQTAQQETSALVAHALDVLPDVHREVLLLRDAEGLSAPETALVLGVSVDAVKSRLHRARSALREKLRPVLERDARPTTSCP